MAGMPKTFHAASILLCNQVKNAIFESYVTRYHVYEELFGRVCSGFQLFFPLQSTSPMFRLGDVGQLEQS